MTALLRAGLDPLQVNGERCRDEMKFCLEGGGSREPRLLDRERSAQSSFIGKRHLCNEVVLTEVAKFGVRTIPDVQRNAFR